MPDPKDLKSFCALLAQKYGDPVQVTEEQKADEFRQVFFSGSPADLCAIQVAAYICGVGLKALPGQKFPRGMRGYHDTDIKGRKTIYYSRDDVESAIQNTILHELREMMEPLLGEACPSYQPLNQTAAHIAANHFATAVLLPQTDFLEQVYQSGLDVIALSQRYGKSCAQILLRMGEVLEGRLPFCGVLYEPHPERPEHWVVSYSTSTANHAGHYIGWLKIDGFFLPRGRIMKPRSIVNRTVRSGKSHLVRYRILQEEAEQGSWQIIAQPVVFDDRVSKVAVVMLPTQNQNLLEPQIEKVEPIELEPIDRYL